MHSRLTYVLPVELEQIQLITLQSPASLGYIGVYDCWRYNHGIENAVFCGGEEDFGMRAG